MKNKDKNIPRLDHAVAEAVYKEQFHIACHPEKYPVTSVPHRHNFYEILWFPTAEGTHHIDKGTFKLTGNDLFLLSQGQVHWITSGMEAHEATSAVRIGNLGPVPPSSPHAPAVNHLLDLMMPDHIGT